MSTDGPPPVDVKRGGPTPTPAREGEAASRPRPELRADAKAPSAGDTARPAASQPQPEDTKAAPAPKPEPPADAKKAAAKAGRSRIATLLILLFCLAFLAWSLAADRLTPHASNARVRAYVVPIVPQVSGNVVYIGVLNNSFVEADDILLQIDPVPYELAVRSAQAALELAGQEIGADTAGVDAAQALLVEARAHLENVRVQAGRIFELEQRGFATVAQADQYRSDLNTAEAQVVNAEAELTRAKENLGITGEDNPRIQSALAALGQARIELDWTTVRAPTRGALTDLRIDVGNFAQVGKPLMTFVSLSDIWLEAYMTENNLGNMEVGDPVEIVFDLHPGEIYTGRVASFTAGAATGREAQVGALPEVEQQTGWLRDPQRFPVLIDIDGYGEGRLGGLRLRAGSQADIIVYTGEDELMNTLGRWWIRVNSWLSYAY